MKGTSWTVTICFGICFLCSCLICAAVLAVGLPSAEMVQRLLSVLGVLATSIALILTGYFIVLAVSAYGHTAHIRETSEKTDRLAEEAKENLEEVKRCETASHDVMEKVTEYAVETVSFWTLGMQQIIYVVIEMVVESPTSKAFPEKRKDELLDKLERIQIELDRSRAKVILGISDITEEVLTQLKMLYKTGEESEIPIVSAVREKWAEDEDIRELCDRVLEHLRDRQGEDEDS